MTGKKSDLDVVIDFEQYIKWMDTHLSEMYRNIIPVFSQPLRDWIKLSYKWANYEEIVIKTKKELTDDNAPTNGTIRPNYPQRG